LAKEDKKKTCYNRKELTKFIISCLKFETAVFKERFYDWYMSVSQFLFFYLQILLSAFSILLLNVATMPYLLAAAIPIVVLFLFIRHYYLKSSREIKRLEAMSKS